MLEKYFRFPFATTGDKAAIPDEVQVSGDVSYQEGYGLDYELDPGVEPSAKNIERDKYNAVLYDVTKAIQEYQQTGYPYFITSAQNGGVAFEYQKFATVFYDDGVDIKLYRSRVDANTALPTNATNWQEIGFTSGNNLTLTGAVFEGSVTDGKWVYWDNANSRFDVAIADGTAAQNVIGIANVTAGGVVVSGEIIGLVSGLTANTAYYLSTTVAGNIVSARPAANAVQVGVSRSATSFHVNITTAQAYASTILAGLMEIATDAEVLAGTDSLRAVVPSSLLSFLGAGESGTNGYLTIPYKDASDNTRKNIILQWGYKGSNGAITFPIAFPNAVFSALTTYGGTGSAVTSNVTSLTTTGLSNTIVTGAFYWFAIGN